jgi:hypothetical protein
MSHHRSNVFIEMNLKQADGLFGTNGRKNTCLLSAGRGEGALVKRVEPY